MVISHIVSSEIANFMISFIFALVKSEVTESVHKTVPKQ
jgi:hypothetical protein